jgi:hypothetical protein
MAKRRKTGGRVAKLTPETQKIILDGVAVGITRIFAAKRASVDDSTVRRWMIRGQREKSGIYRTFFTALKKAEADAVARNVAIIQQAAKGGQVTERTTTTTRKRNGDTVTTISERFATSQWTAAAWWLERTQPDEFASSRHELQELKSGIRVLLKAIKDDKPRHTSRQAPTHQNLGGEADPRAI